jgi:hypothetical protein
MARLLPLAALCFLAAACSHPPPARVPDRLIVYSTEPDGNRGAAGEEVFHGHLVLGKVEVHDPERRAELWKEFKASLTTTPNEVKCFNPRHGLRVVSGGREVDYLVCFQCSNYGEGRGDGSGELFTLNGGPKALLNRVLTESNVPLAPERNP